MVQASVGGPAAARLLAAAVVCVLLSACQLRVATDVVVHEDGSGVLTLRLVLDDELGASLDADEIDPFAGLAELPEPWTAERDDDEGGSLLLSAPFADPRELTSRVADLNDGLSEDDPAVLDDVELDRDGDRWTFSGRAGLRPPASTGVLGGAIAFDGDALHELLARTEDPAMTVELRVHLPGRIVDADADEVAGGTATWRLTPTELVSVTATSEPAPWRPSWLLVAAAAVGAVVVGWGVGRLRSRRARRRRSRWAASRRR